MYGAFGGEIDSSSFSEPTAVVTEHIDLTWKLSFQDCTISGSCVHRIKVLKIGVSHVNFDCSEKLSLNLTAFVNDIQTDVIITRMNNALGCGISVPTPEYNQTGAEILIRFDYTVTSEASASQWLEPSGTKGGKYPYLFTQSCAIHARSLFPCMDTPSVKTTYTAVVTAPTWCTVLMSALLQGVASSTTDSDNDSDMHVFTWHQPVPVPSYLIALAAGNLESREISDRVRIWAEPEVVESAEYEFAQTEDFLSAAEQITGCPYQWSRYDVLCLPPSFPYGGAEMPCLTFVTPTLLAGDRSLADVIAHEIAHSWTGNLVTNHTWAHFWLNEGWTMWLERKIAARVRGSQEYLLLSAQSGWKRLQDELALMGETGEFTALVWPLADRDPDEAFSSVPYEKGFNLLYYLETVVGAAPFEQFAQAYINRFKFGTITSTGFVEFFMGHFVFTTDTGTAAITTTTGTGTVDSSSPAGDTAASGAGVIIGETARQTLSSLDWERLLLSPGMPAHPAPDFTNGLSAAAESLAGRWIAAASTTMRPCDYRSQFAATDIQGWSSLQVTVFLDLLLSYLAAVEKQQEEGEEECGDSANKQAPADSILSPLLTELLQAMDSLYALTASRNAEILLRWQCIAVQTKCEWAVPSVVDFITSQGRMKYVRPLYRALLRSRWRKLAVDTFRDNQHRYHPIARKMIAADMRVAIKQEEEAEKEK